MRMTTKWAPFLIPILFLAACGTGEGNDPSGPTGCDVDNARPGETVVCAVTGFEEDCTVLLGSKPVEASFDEERGEIEFTIPGSFLPGPREISFQCGADEPVTISKQFSVTPTEKPGQVKAECEDNTDCPGGLVCEGGSCIVPPETTPILPGGFNRPRIIEPRGDVRVAPHTFPPAALGPFQGGSGGAVAPELKVAVKTEALHDKRLGLIRIDWEIHGGGRIQKAYLYGSFNRFSSEDGCGLEGKRYLAVNPSGGEIVYEVRDAGESTYERYQEYVEGEKCRGEENCPGFGEHFDPYLSSHGLPICRIDLAGLGDKAGFFTRMIEDGLKFVLAVQAGDGTWKTAEGIFKAPKPEIEDVQVELDKAQPTFHVRFSYRNALYLSVLGCGSSEGLPKRDQDGAVDRSSGDVNLISCPLAKNSTLIITADGLDPQDFKTETYRVECGAPELIFSNGGYSEDGAGDVQLYGRVKRRCDVKKKVEGGTFEEVKTQEVPWVKTLLLIADESVGNRANCGAIGITLDNILNNPDHEPGDCREVSRPYQMTGDGKDDLRIYCSLLDHIEIDGSEAVIQYPFARGHNCTHYKFSVLDLDGKEYSRSLDLPYQPDFKVERQAPPETLYAYTYDSCNHDDESCGDYDCCRPSDGCGCRHDSDDGVWNCRDYRLQQFFTLTGRHIEFVDVRCEGETMDDGGKNLGMGGYNYYKRVTFDPNSYATQVVSHWNTVSGEAVSCKFEAITYDGGRIVSDGWYKVRGSSWCDGEDIDGDDHDDRYNTRGFGRGTPQK